MPRYLTLVSSTFFALCELLELKLMARMNIKLQVYYERCKYTHKVFARIAHSIFGRWTTSQENY